MGFTFAAKLGVTVLTAVYLLAISWLSVSASFDRLLLRATAARLHKFISALPFSVWDGTLNCPDVLEFPLSLDFSARAFGFGCPCLIVGDGLVRCVRDGAG